MLGNQFPRFSTYVVMIHQRYRRTDRWTDDMRSQDRALHCSASRGKNEKHDLRNPLGCLCRCSSCEKRDALPAADCRDGVKQRRRPVIRSTRRGIDKTLRWGRRQPRLQQL